MSAHQEPWEDVIIPPSPSSGSSGNTGSSGSQEEGSETGLEAGWVVLDAVRHWLSRYVSTVNEVDLDLLTVWAVHTWLVEETYTTPRLVLDSPTHGSGKTTTLEHLQRLCRRPILAASLSSPALLTRMLDKELRTILIDEVDRSLRPDKEGVEDLIAVLNSGYKKGATRPVLVPGKKGQWDVAEMPTYSPVAMAGNGPDLPDDTRSRCIRVMLAPARDDDPIEESDWEVIEEEALELADRIKDWAERSSTYVRTNRPPLPEVVRGRGRERWLPLKRVAVAAGGRWPEVIDRLAERDIEKLEIDKEEQIIQERPAMVLLRDIAKLWPADRNFVETQWLVRQLIELHPEAWSERSNFGKDLTAQRLGKMLVKTFDIHADRPNTNGPRGYLLSSLHPTLRRFGLDRMTPPSEPDEPAYPDEPDDLGAAIFNFPEG